MVAIFCIWTSAEVPSVFSGITLVGKPDWPEDYVKEFIHDKQLLISELRAFLDHYRSLHH